MVNRTLIQVILLVLLMTSLNFSQTSSGLIGYWPFNGNANDLSGYGNNGNVHNATLTTDRFGNLNSAYYFNGSAYIDCGPNIPSIYNLMTISVWVKTNTNTNTTAYIVGKYGWTGIPKGYNVMMENTSFLFSFRDGNNDYSTINSAIGVYNDNNWHHIVGTVNNSIYSLWIDGVKIGTNNNGHQTVDLSQAYNFFIGNIFNGSSDWNIYFVGAIDDIRLYNRSLSDSEIQALYNENGWKTNGITISTSSNPDVGGIIIGSGLYFSGSTVTLTAIPNTGYKFINWTENGTVVSTNSTYSFTAAANRNLVANFSGVTYVVSVSSNNAVGGSVSGNGIYNSNTQVQVVATPNTNYKFVSWTENGTVVSTSPTYSFIITKNRNLVANFSNMYTVTTSSNPTSGGVTGGNGIYGYNANVQVIATPYFGFNFVSWTENGLVVSKDSVYSFKITTDRNLTANFSLSYGSITLSSNPVTGGTTTGSGIYNIGTNVLTTATPNSGYYFINWTENGIAFSTNQSYSFIMSASRTLIANFSSVPVLSVSPIYIGVSADIGNGNFSVSNNSGGSMNWTALSNSSWITITSGNIGTNNGTINLSYQANFGAYRVGTITVTALNASYSPQTVEVRQSGIVSVEKLNGVPTSFVLYQNYPNPFNPSTKIQFEVPKESFVILKVFDMMGKEVATLVNETLSAAIYTVTFNANKLNNGIYFYRLQAGEFSQTKKMILLK